MDDFWVTAKGPSFRLILVHILSCWHADVTALLLTSHLNSVLWDSHYAGIPRSLFS